MGDGVNEAGVGEAVPAASVVLPQRATRPLRPANTLAYRKRGYSGGQRDGPLQNFVGIPPPPQKKKNLKKGKKEK